MPPVSAVMVGTRAGEGCDLVNAAGDEERHDVRPHHCRHGRWRHRPADETIAATHLAEYQVARRATGDAHPVSQPGHHERNVCRGDDYLLGLIARLVGLGHPQVYLDASAGHGDMPLPMQPRCVPAQPGELVAAQGAAPPQRQQEAVPCAARARGVDTAEDALQVLCSQWKGSAPARAVLPPDTLVKLPHRVPGDRVEAAQPVYQAEHLAGDVAAHGGSAAAHDLSKVRSDVGNGRRERLDVHPLAEGDVGLEGCAVAPPGRPALARELVLVWFGAAGEAAKNPRGFVEVEGFHERVFGGD
jgi:hypothetical protein